jgi:hypothetical protein
MSGSQPATVGELHPLHRKALRHPLILDGLSDSAAHLAAPSFVGTCPGARPRPTPPCGFVVAGRHRVLCLHVLSSFQRTGCVVPATRPRRVAGLDPRRLFHAQGNLTILLSASDLVNPFAPPPAVYFRRRLISVDFRRARYFSRARAPSTSRQCSAEQRTAEKRLGVGNPERMWPETSVERFSDREAGSRPQKD